MDHVCGSCRGLHPPHISCEEALEMESEGILLQDTMISPIGQFLPENNHPDDSMEKDDNDTGNPANDVPGHGVDGVWDP